MSTPLGFTIRSEPYDRGIQRLGFSWIDNNSQHRMVEMAFVERSDPEFAAIGLRQIAEEIIVRHRATRPKKKGRT